MNIGRRQLLAGSGVAAGAALIGRAAFGGGFRAVAFDGLALFDTSPIAAVTRQLFPEKGEQLVNLWRVKQFDYQWLSALAGQYRDFEAATAGALGFAAKALGVAIAPRQRDQLLHGWRELRAWPEAPAVLESLKRLGLRLAPLANFTPAILESAVANSGLGGMFDELISTDRRRTFKPDPRAYQLGVDAFRLPKEEIVFVASAGWDVAGAAWFGYPTFWVNRPGAPAEELAAGEFRSGKNLNDLAAFVARGAAR